MLLTLNMEFISWVRQDFLVFSLLLCTLENIIKPVSLVKEIPHSTSNHWISSVWYLFFILFFIRFPTHIAPCFCYCKQNKIKLTLIKKTFYSVKLANLHIMLRVAYLDLIFKKWIIRKENCINAFSALLQKFSFLFSVDT